MKHTPPLYAGRIQLPLLWHAVPLQERRCGASLQEIYGQLEEAGHLVEQESQQLYSEAAGKFLADRFVIGTCPKCGFEVSRP